MMERGPVVFGIRHLSPAGAYYVRQFLDQASPRLVLIEGPSDFTKLLEDLGDEQVQPPVAVMAYTKELPIRTLLYPFAEYSPEYQALLWAREHGCPCRFCDLPSDVFLGIRAAEEAGGKPTEEFDVYRALDECSLDKDHETFWERTMEQAEDFSAYEKGAKEFGRSLRLLESAGRGGYEENLVREAYMRRQIRDAVKEGLAPEDIAVVTGAYHVEGILGDLPAMTDKEMKALPRLESM